MAGTILTYIPLGSEDPARNTGEDLVGAVLEHWPSFSEAPGLVLEDPDDLLAAGTLGGAHLVLVTIESRDELGTLYRLIDLIDNQRHSIVVLADPALIPGLRRLGTGVVTLPEDLEPSALALTLSALSDHRPGVDAILDEHDALEHSRDGLQREMNQIQEELQLAARVQREFMPKRLPETPGLAVAALFRPCGYVSGDIYDVVRLDEHHVGFFIADAVGHGVPAALMTMVLSHGMSMKEIRDGAYRIVPPSEVLERCNDALIAGNMPSDRFLTAAYGIIDVRNLTITLAGAGHPPPVVVGPRGSRSIETEGPLLGVFPGAVFDEVTFTIEPDETFVLYSDGFETAFPDETDNPQPGFSRRMPTTHYLEEFATMGRRCQDSGDLTEAFAQLVGAVDQHNGSLHQVDDITALAFTAAPAPSGLTAAA